MSSEAPNRSGENPLRDSQPAKAAELAVPGAYAPNVAAGTMRSRASPPM